MKKVIITIIMLAIGLAAFGATVYAVQEFLPVVWWDFGAYSYPDAGGYTSGEAAVSEAVREIDIDWMSGSVSVGYHDENTVLIQETADKSISSDLKLCWKLDGDKLTVKYAKSGAHIGSSPAKALTVTLPRSVQPVKADIDAVTATVTVNGGVWEELNIDITTGAVNIADVQADRISADTITGRIDADVRNAGDMDLSTVSGKITAAADNFKSITASSTNGSVTAVLPADCGFTADLSTVTGKTACGHKHTDDDGKYIAGDGSRAVSISTVTGNIEITEK